MTKPNIPEIIKERLSLWEKWLLEKQATPVLLIGMSDKGVTTLAPKGVGPADMLKIMEHASGLVKEYFFDSIDVLTQDVLTQYDKDRLIASIDYRLREDYDGEILEQLNSLPETIPDHLQDRTRRALLRFVEERYEDIIAEAESNDDKESLFKACMIGFLINGYNLALLRRKPL